MIKRIEKFDELEDEGEDRNPLYKVAIILLILLIFFLFFYILFFSRTENDISAISENPIPSIYGSNTENFGSQKDPRTLFVNKFQDCSQ